MKWEYVIFQIAIYITAVSHNLQISKSLLISHPPRPVKAIRRTISPSLYIFLAPTNQKTAPRPRHRGYPFNKLISNSTKRQTDFGKEAKEERSMNPDFLFRDKRTREEFWIEAKYRKGIFRNKNGQDVCEICNPGQLNRYKEVEKTSGKRVYICLGLGDDPLYPETVHLIPVKKAYPPIISKSS